MTIPIHEGVVSIIPEHFRPVKTAKTKMLRIRTIF